MLVSLPKTTADSIFLFAAALKNDDADDSGDEDVAIDELERERKEKTDGEEVALKNSIEKQPTGRVVGVFKRNWRA